MGSALLACFLLFSAYLDEVEMLTEKEFKVIDISEPPVFVFSGWSIAAVGFAAEDVIQEVRRQSRSTLESSTTRRNLTTSSAWRW